MAWNEPGNDQKQKETPKDPWGQKPNKKSSKPKDLDDALNQLQKKFSSLMGKGKKSSGGEGSDSGNTPMSGFFGIGIIIIALILIWGATGFFVVQPPEKSAVLRFGKYHETLGPGLHWIPRFVDSETKVNVQKIHTYTYPANEDALMLTKDQNIAAVAITVQFKVNNPQNFLYNVVNPINSLHQATASALRQVIGRMNLGAILTTGREALRKGVKQQLELTLARYNSGLEITSVLLKSARAPDAVRAAYDDAVKAQEDQKRYVNQAQAYAMKVEPIAEGNAKRILEAAKAYKEKVVLNAQANIAPFLAILPEYKKAPDVTRERMYLDALQTVFENSSKILVDSGKGTNNILYLPLEKMLSNQAKAASATATTGSTNSVIPPMTKTESTTSLRPTRAQAGFSYGDLGGKQ